MCRGWYFISYGNGVFHIYCLLLVMFLAFVRLLSFFLVSCLT